MRGEGKEMGQLKNNSLIIINYLKVCIPGYGRTSMTIRFDTMQLHACNAFIILGGRYQRIYIKGNDFFVFELKMVDMCAVYCDVMSGLTNSISTEREDPTCARINWLRLLSCLFCSVTYEKGNILLKIKHYGTKLI